MCIGFRERGRSGVGGERNINVREKQRNIDQLPPIHSLTRDQTHNLGLCPDWELNLQPFGVWNNAPINWTTWQGQKQILFLNLT